MSVPGVCMRHITRRHYLLCPCNTSPAGMQHLVIRHLGRDSLVWYVAYLR